MKKGAWANIPPKSNRNGPICFSPYLYRARNQVERFFNRIKQCRRVATRYDKLAANYLAFVQLASIRLWLRAYESTPSLTRGGFSPWNWRHCRAFVSEPGQSRKGIVMMIMDRFGPRMAANMEIALERACDFLPLENQKHEARRYVASKILECAERGNGTVHALTAAGAQLQLSSMALVPALPFPTHRRAELSFPFFDPISLSGLAPWRLRRRRRAGRRHDRRVRRMTALRST